MVRTIGVADDALIGVVCNLDFGGIVVAEGQGGERAASAS